MTPEIAQKITFFLALIISLTIHEFAHAFSANILGDETAKNEGRMSLNPIVHIDPLGTLILPIIAAFSGLPLFGWAKPVPVCPANLKNPRIGHSIVAAAGPISNLLTAFVCLFIVYAVDFESVANLGNSELTGMAKFFYPTYDLLKALILVNAVLAVFNLLPLPPLDGGAVLSGLMPKGIGEAYDKYLSPNGMYILFILLMTGSLGFVHVAAMKIIAIYHWILSFVF